LILFRLLPNGFRRADLRTHLAELSGRPAESLGPGAMTYQLRRLRLHGMIQRQPNSHRYQVTGHHAVRTPLKQAFDALDARLTASITQLALAASNLTHSHHMSSPKRS
jgi:hypothetical protein